MKLQLSRIYHIQLLSWGSDVWNEEICCLKTGSQNNKQQIFRQLWSCWIPKIVRKCFQKVPIPFSQKLGFCTPPNMILPVQNDQTRTQLSRGTALLLGSIPLWICPSPRKLCQTHAGPDVGGKKHGTTPRLSGQKKMRSKNDKKATCHLTGGSILEKKRSLFLVKKNVCFRVLEKLKPSPYDWYRKKWSESCSPPVSSFITGR